MRVVGISAVVLLFAVSSVWAHTSEDLEFAKAAFARGWFDLAERLAKAIYDDQSNNRDLRSWAAELHFTILEQKGKATGDQTLKKSAEALFDKYSREFGEHEAWRGAIFAKLDRRLQETQDLAKKAEIEPNAQKKKELSDTALRNFEEMGQDWERLIAQFRLQVAQWPPKEQWGTLKMTKEERERLEYAVFQRDLAEYKYAMSLVFHAKVVDKEKRKALLEKGIRKFNRFIDGIPEFEGDKDPPCRGQSGPQDPAPRTNQILLAFSFIGLGQCYYELGDYKKAADNFDLWVEAEIPDGSETSKDDILKIVDIRLQAFYLDASALNKMQKYDDAKKVLERMFDMSGKEIQPDRPEIREYWKKKGEESVALMPKVYEHPYGKMAAMQQAEALAALGEHQEGMTVVWEIFKREAKQKFKGEQSPFEVEAAKTMASIAEKLPNVEFEVGPAYGIARGLESQIAEGPERQKFLEKAAEAYKKALSAKGSEEDKKIYVPESLWELAGNLMNRNKFGEAGPYLIELAQKHLEFRYLTRVPGLLRQCANKARDAGEIDQKKFEEWVKISQSVSLASKLPVIDQTLTEASEAEVEKKYEQARDLYESINKTYSDKDPVTEKNIQLPYPRYAFARARLGATYLNLAEAEKARKNQQAYDKLISLAKSTLEEALGLSVETQDDRANGTARYYLASMYLDDSVPKEKRAEFAEKALDYLKPFDDALKGKQGLEYYVPDVLFKQATVYFILGDYDKMHEKILTLEKEHRGSDRHLICVGQFYDSVKKVGEQVEASNPGAGKPFFEKAAYYAYSWYASQPPDKLTSQAVLWAGKALYDVRGYEKAIEVLKKYFDMIPKKEARTPEQIKSADIAKILMAQCYYGMGKYKEAAQFFDELRHETQCDQVPPKGTCDYEGETGIDLPYDSDLGECPKCKRGKLQWKNDNVPEIQEGAAESYLALYQNSKPKDMSALDKALDIYQIIHKKLSGQPITEKTSSEERERIQSKTFKVKYIIYTIWRERRQQDLVISSVETMILLAEGENWDIMVPVEPWRTKIKEIYELCKKELGGAGK